MAVIRSLRAHRLFVRLRRDCKGASAVEYGLILALIVLALITGLTGLGGQTSTTWSNLYDKIKAVSPS